MKREDNQSMKLNNMWKRRWIWKRQTDLEKKNDALDLSLITFNFIKKIGENLTKALFHEIQL
jgi:hypothetical protein